MIFEGFDGINCTARMAPEEYKIIYEILSRPTALQIAKASEELQKKGFDVTIDQVEGVVKGAAYTMSHLAKKLFHSGDGGIPPEVPPPDPDDEPNLKKKRPPKPTVH